MGLAGVTGTNKGYKKKGPADVIQIEQSKLSYISVTGELNAAKLGGRKKHINKQ